MAASSKRTEKEVNMLVKFDCASEAVFAKLATYLASDENRAPLPEDAANVRGFIASLKEAKRTDSHILVTLELREEWPHYQGSQFNENAWKNVKTDPKYMVAIFKIVTQQD